MIKLNDISKIYKISDNPFYALNKVSLEIEKGEMIAVQGRSGAGKSTLMHILGCLDTYNEGAYFLDGKDISSKNPSQLAHLRNKFFGFVLQDFSLINHNTALYNVMAPMFFDKTPFFDMKKKAIKELEELNLSSQIKKDVVNMSGGQRQRVAIARSLVNDPAIILADEPTGNLDSTTSDEIMHIFKMLHQKGKTIIIVTHDDRVASFCDRIITISDGKIIKSS